MLISLTNQTEAARNLRSERKLWDDGALRTLSLGCTRCPDRGVCGGLHVEREIFDCLALCCGRPATCDAVCRSKPEEFARRVREVSGFLLDNVPRAPVLTAPLLPQVVPILFHGKKRRGIFEGAKAVCLPLYAVIPRHGGEVRYESRLELAKAFGIPPEIPVILTGTATDPPLERWWTLESQRRETIRVLRRLGIALVTTPNYSLFIDQPRWDDLHSMKRIALVHEEFLSEGMPAALHVNARTQRDWDRWGDYITERPEVTHVAFEFGTGAGWARRVSWHAERLVRLATVSGRPLHLVVRGGRKVLPQLAAAFSGITFLETSAFMKTTRRKRAMLAPKGTVNWCESPTKATEPLDVLLMENWRVVDASYARVFDQGSPPLRATG